MTPSTFMLSRYVGEKLNSEKLKIFGKYWISTKFIEPDTPYKILIPNKIKPEANAPNIKYLRAASDDFIYSLLIAVRI